MTKDLMPETLRAELAELTLPQFDETIALRLGAILVRIAQDENLPVVINIRNANRCYFHAALPGSTALNENWARRKSNLALLTQTASLIIGLIHRAKGHSVADEGLSPVDYADHGGAVPLVVKNAGIVAICTASGLPQVEDHTLVLRGLKALLAEPS